MGRAKHLTESEIECVCKLKKAGKSIREIAKLLNRSPNGVCNALKRVDVNGNVTPKKPRQVPPSIITQRAARHLLILAKRFRRKTVPILTEELNLVLSRKVSWSTVRSALKNLGMNGRVAAKKPFLRHYNIRKRLAFAKKHLDWKDEWNDVLFSDESIVRIWFTNRRIFIRRFVGERYRKECLVPTVKHGGGGVTVWGAFSSHGTLPLVKIDGIMKQEHYHNILTRHVVKKGKEMFKGKQFTFQHDNDPKHTAKKNVAYLERQEKKGKQTH